MVTREERAPARDRERTRERILDAAVRVLARRGFGGLGVNAVAREAGVDKVLLYRYFGGLEELVAAVAARPDFWPRPAASGPAGAETPAAFLGRARESLLGLHRGLRERPLTQEVLRWELVERTPLTDRLAAFREAAGIADLGRIPAQAFAGVDVPAVAALLSAGLIYLVLRGKTAPAFLGVSLRDEAGAARVERALEGILDALAGGGPPERPKRSARGGGGRGGGGRRPAGRATKRNRKEGQS
jgi:AcrR family transcriptional regulator